jgi:hypothetical protein
VAAGEAVEVTRDNARVLLQQPDNWQPADEDKDKEHDS